ncbi:hypothetical protein TNCT_232851 [Trichonephila clavata]|uniref:Uncharacterized protein n=1 Tax=Trichonephila clavata TaxID=2740835 RepID=A0A8X6LBY2_TRICU|nr:hypothetical protein TNCT_232851 [Trichonephila clavata]
MIAGTTILTTSTSLQYVTDGVWQVIASLAGGLPSRGRPIGKQADRFTLFYNKRQLHRDKVCLLPSFS